MKRVGVYFVLIMIFLIGCSNENTGDAVVKEASLTDFETNLIQLSTAASFIHEVEINNDEVNEILLFIDLYKNGEKVGTVSEISSQITEAEMHTVFLNLQGSERERQWISAIMTESGYASSQSSNEMAGIEYISSAWGSVPTELNLNIGEKQPVASLIYSNEDSIRIKHDLFTEDALKEQTNYEEVYIFSIEVR